MTPIRPTRLEKWLSKRLGGLPLTRENLETRQLDLLNRTLAHAREKSLFYREQLKASPARPLKELSQISSLPFTTAADVQRRHLDMLSVSHGDVARVVTMHTSGTSSAPKRLYFTREDIEQNIDFFHHGLTCLAEPGQRALVMLPGPTPDSAGDQLIRAMERVPIAGFLHWPVLDLDRILSEIEDRRIDCLVGAPSQVFALCRHDQATGRLRPHTIKSILLSTDYVPRVVADELRKAWQCRVFEHYGMTEMGLGAALHCDAHQGFHLREAELLIEVVDPESGAPLPPGVEGEVVFTTLTREAMPLIRYRTGDRAAWLAEPCPCGSMMRRLGKVRGRIADLSTLPIPITMPQLDEAILALPGLYSFQAAFDTRGGRDNVTVTLFCPEKDAQFLADRARAIIAGLLSSGSTPGRILRVETRLPEELRWDASGMIKRTIASPKAAPGA